MIGCESASSHHRRQDSLETAANLRKVSVLTTFCSGLLQQGDKRAVLGIELEEGRGKLPYLGGLGKSELQPQHLLSRGRLGEAGKALTVAQ